MTLKSALSGMEFIANPRSIDRLNAVCSVFLGIAVAVIVYVAFQPSLNPPSTNGVIAIGSVEAPVAVQAGPVK
ncbi:hypothetical protein BH09SUM1_BH09SUM1_26540 [soil metagenome]